MQQAHSTELAHMTAINIYDWGQQLQIEICTVTDTPCNECNERIGIRSEDFDRGVTHY